jgi:hypothetical protein
MESPAEGCLRRGLLPDLDNLEGKPRSASASILPILYRFDSCFLTHLTAPGAGLPVFRTPPSRAARLRLARPSFHPARVCVSRQNWLRSLKPLRLVRVVVQLVIPAAQRAGARLARAESHSARGRSLLGFRSRGHTIVALTPPLRVSACNVTISHALVMDSLPGSHRSFPVAQEFGGIDLFALPACNPHFQRGISLSGIARPCRSRCSRPGISNPFEQNSPKRGAPGQAQRRVRNVVLLPC